MWSLRKCGLGMLLLLLTIKGFAAAPQGPQLKVDPNVLCSTRTIIMDFDDLATDSTSGIGPRGSFSYQGIHVQSLTVINTTTAAHSKPQLIDTHDISCATSWPNAVIGMRNSSRVLHSWPRLSLRDLYAAHHSHVATGAADDVAFNVISLSMSPLGFVPGPERGYDGAEVQLNFLRMPKKASSVHVHSTDDDDSQTPFPGLVPGEPIRDPNLTFSELTGFYGEGWHYSLPVYLREWFGPDFASRVDVIEIYGKGVKSNGGGEVDWPFCIDDVVLEVIQAEEGDNDGRIAGQREGMKRSERKICYHENTCYTGKVNN